MKRILIIGQTDNPGGVETVIKRYYEFLQQDFRMDLWCLQIHVMTKQILKHIKVVLFS